MCISGSHFLGPRIKDPCFQQACLSGHLVGMICQIPLIKSLCWALTQPLARFLHPTRLSGKTDLPPLRTIEGREEGRSWLRAFIPCIFIAHVFCAQPYRGLWSHTSHPVLPRTTLWSGCPDESCSVAETARRRERVFCLQSHGHSISKRELGTRAG